MVIYNVIKNSFSPSNVVVCSFGYIILLYEKKVASSTVDGVRVFKVNTRALNFTYLMNVIQKNKTIGTESTSFDSATWIEIRSNV